MLVFPNVRYRHPLSSRDLGGHSRDARKRMNVMTQPKGKAASREAIVAQSMTLATLHTALERSGALSATRLRDLRSAVRRIADLLGNEPAGVALDMEAISLRLSTVNPL